MNRLQQAALLTYLAERLRQNDSWCGETHLQKAAYIARDVAGVPWSFDFIIYKHGPFSFDLRDELTSLRADGLLKLEPQSYPYGPRYGSTAAASELRQRYPKTLARHGAALDAIAKRLGNGRVDDLERLATAVYATIRECHGETVEARAAWLHAEKPHISLQDARAAVEDADELIAEFRSFAE